MSKVVKQMQMDVLATQFKGVRDLVLMSIKGLPCQSEGQLRAKLRRKDIHLQCVKNSFTRRVFDQLGMNIPADSPYWVGNTMLAWGGTSIAELSKAIEAELKAPKTAALYKDKVKIKGAVADGQPITFEAATKMPTLAEAIGRVVNLALSPAARLLGQIKGPASNVAGQIKSIGEKVETPAETPPSETPPSDTPPAEAPSA